MIVDVTRGDFIARVGDGTVPPLYSEIPYAAPFEVFEPFSRSRNGILLESVKGSQRIARYSFIGFDPYLIFAVKDGEITVHDAAKGRKSLSHRAPLERLRELMAGYPQSIVPGLPPFQGGAMGLLSYDFVRYIEHIPKNVIDDLQIPDAHFLMVDKVIAFDHLQKRAWVIVSPGARQTELGYRDLSLVDWKSAYDEAEQDLAEVMEVISRAGSNETASTLRHPGQHRQPVINYEMSKEEYMHMVRRAKEYIAAGDIFQANLSQRISSPVSGKDPYEIYKVLRAINPSPFAAYADFGDYQIVSSSPERLVRLKENVIETRPIAGTRPRGRDVREDEEMRTDLLLNEKERAEHIMLIDLERNDIGRVAECGSVEVDELMITEEYSHVIHIVSNVRGLLDKGKNAIDVVRATFPGGTITGVPKVRCMEIIDELEPVARGPYTGSLGYIGFSGEMDLNIIIRTFVMKDGNAYVQAGAGIVADSDPEREYYETLKKAEALIRTLERV